MQTRSLLIILLFILHAQLSEAQWNQPLYNQLTINLRNASDDLQKFRAMLALGDYHIEQSYMNGFQQSMDTALSLAKQCEDLAREKDDKLQLAEVYTLLSKATNYSSQYPESIEYAWKAITLASSVKSDTGVFHANRALFRAHIYMYNLDTTKIVTDNNLILAKKIGTDKILAMAFEDCGDNAKYNQLNKKAIIFFDEALRYYKVTGRKDIQHILGTQAYMHNYLGEQDKAFPIISRAVKLAEELNDQTYYMIELYSQYAGVLEKTDRWESAELYYLKALSIGEKYTDPLIISDISLKLQQLKIKSGTWVNSDEAIQLIKKYLPYCTPVLRLQSLATLLSHHLTAKEYKEAEKYYKELKPWDPKVADFVTRAASKDVFRALSQYALYQKDTRQAQQYLEKFFETIEFTVYDKPFYHYMQFAIDSLNGNYQQAIKSYQLAANYEDTIFSLRKNRQLTELEVQYDVEARKKDNELLKKETELQTAGRARANSQRNIFLGGMILLSVIIALVVRQYRLNQKSREEIASKNNELEKLLTDKENLLDEKEDLLQEKDWLLKEIHHRVKNNLQVVMSLLNTQSYFLNDETAKEAIKNSQHRIHSMSLIHKKLYQSDSISSVNMAVYFDELLEYYKIAFDTGDRIRFVLQSEAVELDPSQAVPVGLILNEAVNNALKHAFPDNRKGQITVLFKTLPQNKLLLSVKDNGIGIPGGVSPSGFSSLGMKLIRGFSGELNAELKISSADGMDVSLVFENNNMSEILPQAADPAQNISA